MDISGIYAIYMFTEIYMQLTSLKTLFSISFNFCRIMIALYYFNNTLQMIDVKIKLKNFWNEKKILRICTLKKKRKIKIYPLIFHLNATHTP